MPAFFMHNMSSIARLKSEVANASLFCQTKQTKTFLLQVKAITKSPGLLSLSNFEICIKKQNSLVLKLKT